jgi:hypothetical protein
MEEKMAVYRVHGGGIWSTTSDDARQLQWLTVLTTLCNNLEGTVKEQIEDQRLEWAMILFNKGYQKETEGILKNDIAKIMKLRLLLIDENNKLITDPAYYSGKVSGRFLLKSLRHKFSNRSNNSN